VTTYYYLGGRLVAMRQSTTLTFIHQDHLTGTSVVSDSSGALVSSIKYYPFGECRNSQGNPGTDKLFTGQRLDGTGLYYYGARYYDASMGRFISADPTIPDSENPKALNRYAYALNNPLKYVDPSGLDYLLVGGSGSTEEDMLIWKQQLIDSGMLAEGEYVYILWDIDPELAGWEMCDVDPRLSQLDEWLIAFDGHVTDLKIIAHSEGAAAVGTYIADWLHGTGTVSESSANLLNSQLTGVFLVECPTGGIMKGFIDNYDWTKLNGIGDELTERGIKAANIYNDRSIVNSTPLEGWQRYNVASWNDFLFAGIPVVGPPWSYIYHHSSAKKDSLTVIKSILKN
jgi:RHS repeat-associated protein